MGILLTFATVSPLFAGPDCGRRKGERRAAKVCFRKFCARSGNQRRNGTFRPPARPPNTSAAAPETKLLTTRLWPESKRREERAQARTQSAAKGRKASNDGIRRFTGGIRRKWEELALLSH